jgi:hypothetical protein
MSKIVRCCNTKTVKVSVPECTNIGGTPSINLPIYTSIATCLKALHKVESAWFDIFAVTDLLVSSLVMNNPHLQELYLTHALYVTDKLAQVIGQHCRHLRILSWENMDNISDAAFCHIIEGCPNLEKVYMRTATDTSTEDENLPVVPALTNLTLSSFAKHSKKLKVLSFKTCFEMPDLGPGLIAVAEGAE